MPALRGLWPMPPLRGLWQGGPEIRHPTRRARTPPARTGRRAATQPDTDLIPPLSGADDLYRVRSGDYRVIYQLRDEALLVLVVRIGHRRDVYRT